MLHERKPFSRMPCIERADIDTIDRGQQYNGIMDSFNLFHTMAFIISFIYMYVTDAFRK